MIFLSQVLHAPIFDSKDEEIGRVKDIIVTLREGQYPKISGVIFKDGKHDAMIPYQCIELLSRGEVTLNRSNC